MIILLLLLLLFINQLINQQNHNQFGHQGLKGYVGFMKIQGSEIMHVSYEVTQ
jgi:hypothetical protein